MSVVLLLIPMALSTAGGAALIGGIAAAGGGVVAGAVGAGALLIAAAVGATEGEKHPDFDGFELETPATDRALLIEALAAFGAQPEVLEGIHWMGLNGAIQIDYKGYRAYFALNEAGVYKALFSGGITRVAAQEFLDEVLTTYTHTLQQKVYKQLLSRAQEQGMTLESEAVGNDNSIVLTFTVENQSQELRTS